LRVTLWPRSLFGRLALLLLLAILLSQAAAIYLFREDRAALLARQFSDTKLVQLRALRAALAATDPRATDATLARFGEAYGASHIVPDAERRFVGGPPQNPLLVDLERRLTTELGPGTELRIQPRLQLLWIKLIAGDSAYWAGFPLPRPSEETPSLAFEWSLVILVVMLVGAYLFARYLARPLRQLNEAVTRVGEGKSPPPLPENGPSEIVNLSRGFNRMLSNLQQIEQDRALLLAGVSHDLRTPLSRLRLGIEVETRDDKTLQGMVEDIEEMDRIIAQFLDFARDGREAGLELDDPNDIIATVVERHRRAGQEIRFVRGELPRMPLRPTAFLRLVSNLVDNALRHGAPPVEIATRMDHGAVVLEVADRGPGIPPSQVEHLKRPFTRGEAARSGASGAGLGLAIVERIARLHGGTLDLLPREGGGTRVRLTFPAAGVGA
jgi:two-component system osmolarity sensor histidine kinase EnvZ